MAMQAHVALEMCRYSAKHGCLHLKMFVSCYLIGVFTFILLTASQRISDICGRSCNALPANQKSAHLYVYAGCFYLEARSLVEVPLGPSIMNISYKVAHLSS
jgi:hypothetical protein